MADALDNFCEMICSEYLNLDNILPEELAGLFVGHSGLSKNPALAELDSVLHRYGVKEITALDLKAGKLKGHHFSYKEQDYTVMYEKDLWKGSIEHVMMHELYEIIAERSEKYCPGYKVLPLPKTCTKANRFAAATLMQPDIFSPAFIESGLDIIQLHHRFGKAYSSVAIRAIEVVNAINQALPDAQQYHFIIAVYQRGLKKYFKQRGFYSRYNFNVEWSVRTQGIRLGNRGVRWQDGGKAKLPNYRAPRYPWHLMPKRGDLALPNSVVSKVIRTGKSCYVEKVTGFDFWGFNDLALIARPVRWCGKVAKVILVGVRTKDKKLLEPQLQKLNLLKICESYQEI